MLKRLRIKFIFINMTIVTIMLCIILGMVMHFTHTSLESQNIQMMQELSSVPIKFTPPGMPTNQVRLPYFTLQQERNEILVASNNSSFDLSDKELLTELLNIASNSDESTGIIEEYSLRYYRVNTPTGEHVVFTDISSEINTLDHLLRNCIIIGVGAFLIFFVLSWLLARWAIRPVEDAWTQQKQFVGDASHELKTPLTVITTNAELLQMTNCSESERAQFSNNILTMARQMRGLVESLLNLARVDDGSAKLTFSSVDFSELVSNAILPFEAMFFEQNLEFINRIEKNLSVKGDESHLRQVVEILLDNAQKYSHPQTVVHLTLTTTGRNHCLLSVTNTGDVISKEDLKNIFKRFYRVDQTRSMNHSYGLGLSIAENIVQQHKGKIWAESQDGRNTFYVQLPLL